MIHGARWDVQHEGTASIKRSTPSPVSNVLGLLLTPSLSCGARVGFLLSRKVSRCCVGGREIRHSDLPTTSRSYPGSLKVLAMSFALPKALPGTSGPAVVKMTRPGEPGPRKGPTRTSDQMIWGARRGYPRFGPGPFDDLAETSQPSQDHLGN